MDLEERLVGGETIREGVSEHCWLTTVVNLTSLNPFSRSDLEACPCIELATMDLAKDLELPGLPTKKRGMRNSMHTAIMKMFSLRAAFRAMFGPRVMLSNSTS